MSARFPRIRRCAENGHLVLREGLTLCFFMRRSHEEVAPAIARTLALYRRAVGLDKLRWYVGPEGDMCPLDDKGWAHVLQELLDSAGGTVELEELGNEVGGYHFEYRGRNFDKYPAEHWPDLANGASFWLPTEYLEEHGPGRIVELALELARELPLSSGYVSLAFNHLDTLGVGEVIRDLCFQYPGMDIHHLSGTCLGIGTRARGAYWLNFYGEPLLEQLGGVTGLRSQLNSPEVSVQALGENKAMVTLGEWPTVGDSNHQQELQPYRELARILEPHLFEESIRWHGFTSKIMRQWQRRFLD